MDQGKQRAPLPQSIIRRIHHGIADGLWQKTGENDQWTFYVSRDDKKTKMRVSKADHNVIEFGKGSQ